MRRLVFAAIAAMFAFAAQAADAPMTTTTTLTKEQCTTEMSKCTDEACKQDLQTKHPECKAS